MLRDVLVNLDWVSPLLLLSFVLVWGGVAWRRDYVFWFVVAQLIFNGAARALEVFFDADNLYLYHLNCAVSMLLLSSYFTQSLPIKRNRQVMTGIYLLFLLFFGLNLALWEGPTASFNSNTFGLASFILVTYCFLFYRENLLRPASPYISRARNFWYVTGIFTYYASSSFIFISYRHLTQSNTPNLGFVWQIHNVLLLIMCVYILIGILCKPSLETYKL